MDVSIVLFVPPKSTFVQPSLNSILASQEEAQKVGIQTELLVVRNEKPSKWYEERENAIHRASGKYLVLVEAGDLLSKKWVKEAFKFAQLDRRENLIFHPDLSMIFGKKNYCIISPDQEKGEVDPRSILWTDIWSPISMTTKKFLKECPLVKAVGDFGSSHWAWNALAVEKGGIHKTVPETIVFLRENSIHANEFVHPNWSRPVQPVALSDGFRVASVPSVPRQERKLLGENWIMEEWKEIHSIEPRLYPRTSDLGSLILVSTPKEGCNDHYEKAVKEISKFDLVLILPFLKRGGAELEALLHIQAIKKLNESAKIAVIATEPKESEWAERLPKDVVLVEFGRWPIETLSYDQKCRLLLRLLIDTKPRVIHLKLSELGWTVFNRGSQVLKINSELVATVYCAEKEGNGSTTSRELRDLPECYDNLKTIITDSKMTAEQLRHIYGFKKVSPVYFPVTMPISEPPARTRSNETGLEILWASRITHQKRIDFVFELADVFRRHHFHIYGDFVFYAPDNMNPIYSSVEKFREHISTFPNITYHGSFDNFQEIDPNKFDLFLYTSRWDGLPNILLEAGASGLPIIAPNVGGIPELINEKSGFLAMNDQDYYRFLEEIDPTSKETMRKLRNLQNIIGSRHSYDELHSTTQRIFSGFSFQ